MAESKERIDALAALMEEYRLTEANLDDGGFRVAFRRYASPPPATTIPSTSETVLEFAEISESAAPPIPTGTPVTTPMSGIFYDAPSPSSPPFVQEGDSVTAGQIVGLIEAMKVFNEIPSPIGGIVKKAVAESGAVVNVGDTLLLIG